MQITLHTELVLIVTLLIVPVCLKMLPLKRQPGDFLQYTVLVLVFIPRELTTDFLYLSHQSCLPPPLSALS